MLNGIILLKIYLFSDPKLEIGNPNTDNSKALSKHVLKKMEEAKSVPSTTYTINSYLRFCRHAIGAFVSEDITFVLI